MNREIKYEIEEHKNWIAPSTRVIKIDWSYLWDACPHCGRWWIFEFPTKEIAEKYLHDIKETAEKNFPNFIEQIAKWATSYDS